jgi:hypothetical protein
MALVLADRVKETTTSTGTGTVTLAGASTGFQAFSVIGDGNTTYYVIAGQGTSEWEVGIGTYTLSGTTLARTTVLASSNSGSLVTFSAGTKDVFVSLPSTYIRFQESQNTSAPNATINVSAITSVAASTNADVAFVAKGTGATLAQVPDSTTTGGNKRGIRATDWQKSRSLATAVASGAVATIGGGTDNTASGNYSVVGGGISNTASGANSSVIGGSTNTASNTRSAVAGGQNNTASGISSSIVGGDSNSAQTDYSFVGGGFTNSAQTSTYATVVGGANNIASGQYSFVGGGGDAVTATNRNTASAQYTSVVGGQKNTASGDYSFVGGGATNTASGQYSSITSGESNSSGGLYSFIGAGFSNNASGSYAAVVGGVSNVASGDTSIVLGGRYGTTRSIYGNFVTAASVTPIQAKAGVQQSALLILGRQTTDATATVLASDANAAGTTNQVILPNNSAYYFKGSISAGVTGGGNSSMWSFEGGIKRGANAAATTLMNSVINLVAQDAGASTWVIALAADTTNGGLRVTVTGQAATTIRWVCKIETTEMTF